MDAIVLELDKRTPSVVCSQADISEEKAEPIEIARPAPQQVSQSTSPVQIPVVISSSEKPEETKENLETTKPTTEDKVEGPPSNQDKETKPITLNESLMEDLTPNTRRKVFRKAFSMRISRDNEEPSDKVETAPQEKKASDVQKSHSFGGGDKVQAKSMHTTILLILISFRLHDNINS